MDLKKEKDWLDLYFLKKDYIERLYRKEEEYEIRLLKCKLNFTSL